MFIKNKFLRFIVSVFIALLIYFMLALLFDDDALETMILFAVFGFFIVIPSLIFTAYTLYYLLTQKKERSKKASRVLKIMMVLLSIIALLYVAAMKTDLLDNLF